jgi:hypothetical protein
MLCLDVTWILSLIAVDLHRGPTTSLSFDRLSIFSDFRRGSLSFEERAGVR